MNAYGGSQSAERKIALLNASSYVEVLTSLRANRGLSLLFTPASPTRLERHGRTRSSLGIAR